MTPRTVRGVIVCDLSPHGGEGTITSAGETYAWSVLARLRPGQAVHVMLGGARYVSLRLLDIVQDGLQEAGPVQVSGSEPGAVDAVVSHLAQADVA